MTCRISRWPAGAVTCGKAARLSATDDVTGEDVALIRPRADRWDEHFSLDVDGGCIVGLTPEGRATIALLDMNHPAQVVARSLWIRLGLYP